MKSNKAATDFQAMRDDKIPIAWPIPFQKGGRNGANTIIKNNSKKPIRSQ